MIDKRVSMNRLRFALATLTALMVCSAIVGAQSRGGNWPTYGGDTQRSGWEGADTAISTETVKDLQLLWKIKLESQPKGLRPLMPPVILGRLISYRGFKELAFVGTNSDIVYAIDADTGKVFWQKHLEYSTREPQANGSSWRCPGGMTAMPTMPAPAAAGPRGAPGPAGAAPGRGGGGGFAGGAPSVYAISSDGRLHRLNTSTGDDIVQPVSVLPANSKAYSLNMTGNVIYTVTSQGCNGTPNAIWSIDLNGDAPKATSFALDEGSVWGLAGTAIGSDGSVYAVTGNVGAGGGAFSWSNTLLALSPRDLKVQQSFTASVPSGQVIFDGPMNAPSPVVFTFKNRDVIAMGANDGRLYLLDSASLGGENHSTPLFRTPPVVDAGGDPGDHGMWGSLSSWQDATGTRWVLAPVWGRLNPDLKTPGVNGPTPNGAIVAFKVEDRDGRPVLSPAWISRDMNSPLPPVIANGVVFAVSAGDLTRQFEKSPDGDIIVERFKTSTHATLYALDAATGKELYSSRNLITSPAALTGLTVANGRIYFGTADGTLYAFGK
jgi:outer membrane protein assembly factor BamB